MRFTFYLFIYIFLNKINDYYIEINFKYWLYIDYDINVKYYKKV